MPGKKNMLNTARSIIHPVPEFTTWTSLPDTFNNQDCYNIIKLIYNNSLIYYPLINSIPSDI